MYVGDQSELRGAVLGHRVHLKPRVSLYEGVVIGDGSTVGTRSLLRPEVKVWPDKYIESGSVLSNSLIWGTRWCNSLFGNLGIDKTFNQELTPEFAARLGMAYGSLLPEKAQVVIGADNSRPARTLKRAMIAGFLATGVNIFDLGIATTPVARYALAILGAAGRGPLAGLPRNGDGILVEFLDGERLCGQPGSGAQDRAALLYRRIPAHGSGPGRRSLLHPPPPRTVPGRGPRRHQPARDPEGPF